VRVEFLSSTPLDPREGSGTFVGVDGLARGLARLGHAVAVRPLRLRTRVHTLDRWLYNAAVRARPPAADLVVGVDLDGFLWAGRRPGTSRYVVALKGIIADERENERGLVRALLGIQAGWERRNARAADRVVVPSAYSARVAQAVYGVPPVRLAVVPEPIDLGEWQRRFAAAIPRPPGRPTVLAVARMYPRKRLDDLLRAAVALRRRIPDVAVRIVGAGPESARLHALHGELGLGGCVDLLGEVSRATLAVEYASATCFCLPTIQEGFGIVFAEAMAAGLPIVACRAAAVPEVVADGETGVLVTPRRPDELAAALERVLTAPELRARLGAAGRRRVTQWDLERVAQAFLDAAANGGRRG
jgi:phosphatidylinositol alpha-1,6-mannosyltransferase